jgi:DNA-directed RNA polymerase specialized sigma24 family protein
MHKFDNQYKITGYDTDDIIQELRLSLLRAQQLFKPNGKASFMTYLYRAFDFKMKLLYRNVQGRKKDIPENRILYINDKHHMDIEVSQLDENLDTAELLAGLGKEARKLSEQILQGNTTPKEWLAAGLSEGDIEHGKQELIIALTDGAIPLVSKKG